LVEYKNLNSFDTVCLSKTFRRGLFDFFRWKTISLSDLKFRSRRSKANIQLVIFIFDEDYKDATYTFGNDGWL
jgi:hypothetical protein